MTLFGAIWLAALVVAFLREKDDYLVVLLLFSGVLQSENVLIIAGRGVGPFVVTSLVYIFRYVFFHYQELLTFVSQKNFKLKRLGKNATKSYGPISILMIGAILISLLANPATLSARTILYLGLIIIYIICFNVILKSRSQISGARLQRIIIAIIDFVIVMGVVQLLIFILGIPRDNIIATLFYSDTIGGSLAYYSTTKIRLFSTFMEPSYCGAFLVGALFYVCNNYEKIKFGFIRICIIGLAIILTRSTTAYVAVAVCGFLFFIIGRNFTLLKKLLPIGIVGLLIIVASGNFSSVIANKWRTGSAWERASWNTQAIGAIVRSPLFGIGYKSSRASSFFLTLLSEQGLLGLGAFGLLVKKNVSYLVDKTNSAMLVGATWFFIGVLICQIIAVPDFDFCVLWMSIYILGFSIVKKELN